MSNAFWDKNSFEIINERPIDQENIISKSAKEGSLTRIIDDRAMLAWFNMLWHLVGDLWLGERASFNQVEGGFDVTVPDWSFPSFRGSNGEEGSAGNFGFRVDSTTDPSTVANSGSYQNGAEA